MCVISWHWWPMKKWLTKMSHVQNGKGCKIKLRKNSKTLVTVSEKKIVLVKGYSWRRLRQSETSWGSSECLVPRCSGLQLHLPLCLAQYALSYALICTCSETLSPGLVWFARAGTKHFSLSVLHLVHTYSGSSECSHKLCRCNSWVLVWSLDYTSETLWSWWFHMLEIVMPHYSLWTDHGPRTYSVSK